MKFAPPCDPCGYHLPIMGCSANLWDIPSIFHSNCWKHRLTHGRPAFNLASWSSALAAAQALAMRCCSTESCVARRSESCVATLGHSSTSSCGAGGDGGWGWGMRDVQEFCFFCFERTRWRVVFVVRMGLVNDWECRLTLKKRMNMERSTVIMVSSHLYKMSKVEGLWDFAICRVEARKMLDLFLELYWRSTTVSHQPSGYVGPCRIVSFWSGFLVLPL